MPIPLLAHVQRLARFRDEIGALLNGMAEDSFGERALIAPEGELDRQLSIIKSGAAVVRRGAKVAGLDGTVGASPPSRCFTLIIPKEPQRSAKGAPKERRRSAKGAPKERQRSGRSRTPDGESRP